ncbi:phosphatase PAP2 family protein [Oxalobacteraceae bacterium A2-2]
MRFIEARLTPGGEFGLHLTAGMALLVAAVALFHNLAEDVMEQDAITRLDAHLAHWLHAHAFEPMTTILLGVTHLHSGPGMAVLVAALAAWLWRRHARYWLLALLCSVPGGMILNVLLKYIYQRDRPVFEQPLVTLLTYSFPSGHTAAATLYYGLLACYIVVAGRGRKRRGAVAAAGAGCVLMALLVGFSRMYLGAHYLSDVLAAMLESVGWLAVCITAISTLRRRREGRAVL